MIENPRIEHAIITLADVKNEVKVHIRDTDSLKNQNESEKLKAFDDE